LALVPEHLASHTATPTRSSTRFRRPTKTSTRWWLTHAISSRSVTHCGKSWTWRVT